MISWRRDGDTLFVELYVLGWLIHAAIGLELWWPGLTFDVSRFDQPGEIYLHIATAQWCLWLLGGFIQFERWGPEAVVERARDGRGFHVTIESKHMARISATRRRVEGT